MSTELTPLQRAEAEVRRAETQPDYMAMAMQTMQRQAESSAVMAAALARQAEASPARSRIAPADVAMYTVLGVVLVALLLTVAIAAPSVLLLWMLGRKMLNEQRREH